MKVEAMTAVKIKKPVNTVHCFKSLPDNGKTGDRPHVVWMTSLGEKATGQ